MCKFFTLIPRFLCSKNTLIPIFTCQNYTLIPILCVKIVYKYPMLPKIQILGVLEDTKNPTIVFLWDFFVSLQLLRSVVGFDGLGLDDDGRVTPLDATGGRGDCTGDVAARHGYTTAGYHARHSHY